MPKNFNVNPIKGKKDHNSAYFIEFDRQKSINVAYFFILNKKKQKQFNRNNKNHNTVLQFPNTQNAIFLISLLASFDTKQIY